MSRVSRAVSRRAAVSSSAHRVAQLLQVIGELDQHDAHVLHHREQHLAQRLELGGLLLRPQPLLRHGRTARRSAPMRTTPSTRSAIDLPKDSRSFPTLAGATALATKQQRGSQRLVIEPQLAQDSRRIEGVLQQRLARGQAPVAIQRRDELQRAPQSLPVRGRQVTGNIGKPRCRVLLRRGADEPQL